MLFTFLDRIGGLFNKRFLFASVLPLLIFFSFLALTFIAIIGFAPALDWASDQTVLQKALDSSFIIGVVIVCSYVLGALHPALLGLWSGDVSFQGFAPFRRRGEDSQRAYFDSLVNQAEAAAHTIKRYTDSEQHFRSAVDLFADFPGFRYAATDERIHELLGLVSQLCADPHTITSLSTSAQPAEVTPTLNITPIPFLISQPTQPRWWTNWMPWILPVSPSEHSQHQATLDMCEAIGQRIAIYHLTYTEQSLERVFASFINTVTTRRSNCEQFRRDTLNKLELSFSERESIRATALGNLIESYESYPHTRYRMEGVTFWPALRAVIPESFLKVLDDGEAALNFAVSLSTLSGVYMLLSLGAGPWLWDNLTFWLVVIILDAIAMFGCYKLAVSAAFQYGAARRASVDLYRLELMNALYRPHPPDLSAERKQWQQLSQLAIYRETDQGDYTIRPREQPPVEPTPPTDSDEGR